MKHVARQTHPETEISYRCDIYPSAIGNGSQPLIPRRRQRIRFLRSDDIKILLKSLVTVLLALGSMSGGAVFAESETYIGLQYGMATYQESDIELEPITGILRIGRNGEGSFGYEARLGTGLAKDKKQLFGSSTTEAEVEIDSIFGVYLLGHIDMTGSASVYGILGNQYWFARSRGTLTPE